MSWNSLKFGMIQICLFGQLSVTLKLDWQKPGQASFFRHAPLTLGLWSCPRSPPWSLALVCRTQVYYGHWALSGVRHRCRLHGNSGSSQHKSVTLPWSHHQGDINIYQEQNRGYLLILCPAFHTLSSVRHNLKTSNHYKSLNQDSGRQCPPEEGHQPQTDAESVAVDLDMQFKQSQETIHF